MSSLRTAPAFAFLLPLAVNAQLTCADAVVVDLGTYTAPAVTGAAPTTLCAGQATPGSAGLWYRFTPATDMLVTVSSYVTGFPYIDTRLHVYTGTCGALVCYSGGDDEGPGYTSIATFPVTGGTTYLMAWDNFWSSDGFTFTVQESWVPENVVVFSTNAVPGMGNVRGAVDMNDDGRDDLVAPGSTSFNVAYQGDAGAFPITTFPTTAAVNNASWSFAVGDWDSNGHRDLLYGGGNGATFMTANADGSAYTQFSPPEYIFCQRTNFVDLNNDGHLDAFSCHDVDANVAFINNGAGQLVHTQGGYGTTCGNYGSLFTDIDNDGGMDLFVAKCGCDPEDLLMLNNGTGGFADIAPSLGLDDGHQSWSSGWGDFDNDGDMDALIGASSGAVHKLLYNNGDGTFTDAPPGNGMDLWAGTSIEWTAHDFNNDGWIDILGGGALHYNNGDGTFSHDPNAPGNGPVGDLNSDGFLDIATSDGFRRNGGNANNWIRINPRGTLSNRDAIGARVTVTSALGTQIRDIRSGDGFGHMSFIGAHFGLGADTEVQEVSIRWPNGTVESITDPAINTTHVIEEGTVTAVAEPRSIGVALTPNPAQDMIIFSGAGLNSAYEVLEASGRTVLAGRALNGRVPVQALPSGAYVLRLIGTDGVHTARFVKQ
ncbi:MAG TPA: FG-GAP-like repeat-containing protein [Flavobacteriales bacterium]|nr:FG-GAP-like repeat-containing protein [Flavobacteriales bacterium]